VSRFLKVMPRLPVCDLQQAIAFYTDVLGFTVGSLWPRDPNGYLIIFSEETTDLPTCRDDD